MAAEFPLFGNFVSGRSPKPQNCQEKAGKKRVVQPLSCVRCIIKLVTNKTK